MKSVCVVIPVYKEVPNELEMASFRQVCNVLKKYEIFLFTHRDVNLSCYLDEDMRNFVQLHIEYFNRDYFTSIKGYNRLCLTSDFYKRVINYEYMLLYQLDAWVFRDELEYWCNQGYDYVGAPWFKNFGAYENGEKLWAVGNGGLSLRRNIFFYKMLNSKYPITCKVEYTKGFKQMIKSLLKSVGVHNTMNYWINVLAESVNEDFLLTNYFNYTNRRSLLPKLPSPEIAARFSFEKSPTFLFGLCNNQLPFGCHAFEKYEYDTFWKKHILL